jgi:ribosomal protein L17
MKANSQYTEETGKMETNDEVIEIKHTKNRMQRARFMNEELFQAAKRNKLTRVRVVKFPLKTGEIEYLITNLEDFTYEEMTNLYTVRWGIETLYYTLKYKLQIEKFTSSIPQIIEQDFLSSLLVYNIIQTTKNEAERLIDQNKYKHEMKINENMAVGFFKNELILLMLEKDEEQRLNLYDKLISKIFRFKVPIRKGRTFERKFKRENKNSFNKLKSF